MLKCVSEMVRRVVEILYRKAVLLMSKASRRKHDRPPAWRRRRGESREGAEFRREVIREQVFAGLGAVVTDPETLTSVANYLGSILRDGVPLPMIEPARPFADHMEFDRIVCGCGLKRYFRPVMPDDRPGSGTPINPQTGQPDPTITIPPEFQGKGVPGAGRYLLIQEVTPGVRMRFDAPIQWLREPVKG
jgi:hypothetical protein